MDNEQLARVVETHLNRSTGEIRRDIGRLEGLLDAHRKDAFAHQEMVARYEPVQHSWSTWRDSVNIRLAAISGGLAVLAFVTTVFGSIVVQHVIFRG